MKESKVDKVVIIGTGFVGMSYAYALLNQGTCDELVLIDIDENKAKGESLDLAHGLAFCPNKMTIKYGNYQECNDANIIVITAGANQAPGETRLDLLKKNTKVMKEIVKNIKDTSFGGVIIVTTNPVDVLANIVYLESGYSWQRVIGSGTLLDTARLRYEISEKLHIDPRIVHAYILGEHGDSEFMCISHAYISIKPLKEYLVEKNISLAELDNLTQNVKNAAYEIISLKKATYYAIGLALTRLTKAILDDEKTIMPISTYVDNEYKDINEVYVGVPAVIGANGVVEIVKLNLDQNECEALKRSASIIKENVDLFR